MDATNIPVYLTDIDDQIAAVERNIAALRADIAHFPLTKKQRATLAALQDKHEQLMRQVQWATVGAAKPGEVL